MSKHIYFGTCAAAFLCNGRGRKLNKVAFLFTYKHSLVINLRANPCRERFQAEHWHSSFWAILGPGLFLFVMIADLFLVFKLKKGQFFSGLENASSQTKMCSVKNLVKSCRYNDSNTTSKQALSPFCADAVHSFTFPCAILWFVLANLYTVPHRI